jgi:hypothetical protein
VGSRFSLSWANTGALTNIAEPATARETFRTKEILEDMTVSFPMGLTFQPKEMETRLFVLNGYAPLLDARVPTLIEESQAGTKAHLCSAACLLQNPHTPGGRALPQTLSGDIALSAWLA